MKTFSLAHNLLDPGKKHEILHYIALYNKQKEFFHSRFIRKEKPKVFNEIVLQRKE